MAYFGVSLGAKRYRSMPREARKVLGQNDALDFAFQRLLKVIIRQASEFSYCSYLRLHGGFLSNLLRNFKEAARKESRGETACGFHHVC